MKLCKHERGYSIVLSVASVLLCAACAPRGADSLHNAVKPNTLSVQEWVSLGQPSDAHKILSRMVGDWDVEIATRAAPGAQPDISHGRSRLTWILGERFVEERFAGIVSGKAYEGLGFFGYDNSSRRYTSVWLESLSTAITTSHGVYNPDHNTLELVGSVYDPLLGRMKESVTKIKLLSAQQFTLSLMEPGKHGVDFAAFELKYTRRSGAASR